MLSRIRSLNFLFKYLEHLLFNSICLFQKTAGIDLISNPTNETQDCNRCIEGYNYLNVLLTSSFGIGETITYLSGPTFCSQPDYLAQDLAEKCMEFLSEFLPFSLPASANQLTIYAPELCSTLFDLC